MTGSPATVDDLARLESKVDALAERLTSTGSRWLSLADAARYAAMSEVSFRRLVASGRVTAHRPLAGKIVIDKRQLDSLILSATRRPRSGRGRRRTAENAVP